MRACRQPLAAQHAQLCADLRHAQHPGQFGQRAAGLARLRRRDLQRAPFQTRAQLSRRAISHQRATIKDRQPMAAFGFVHVVGRHQHRGSGIGQLEQRLPEIAARFGIDRAGRFIQEQQFGRMHHGAGQGQALLLSTTERTGQLRLPVLQPVLLQQCVHLLPGLRTRQVLDGGEKLQVFAHRQVFIQREALGHVADAPAQCLCLLGHGQAQHLDLPRAGLQQAAQHADGGRLAGPVRPQEAVHLPARHGQVDVVHGQKIAEAARQPACVDRNVLAGIQKRTCTGSPAGSFCMSAAASTSISAR